ncbi:MAG: hypothetical protein JO267_10470 [Alphaproteobacteria bacterium]|nr:hypothetical protein [Alphaproteobacteria bacterium]
MRLQTLSRRLPGTRGTALLGLVIGGVMYWALDSTNPHLGEQCAALGKVEEEWRLGVEPQFVMCIATSEGDLKYGRVIMPPKKTGKVGCMEEGCTGARP